MSEVIAKYIFSFEEIAKWQIRMNIKHYTNLRKTGHKLSAQGFLGLFGK